MRKLLKLSEFVDEVENYVNESHDYERGINLIFAYNEFLNQPIHKKMFLDKNPMFVGFEKMSQYKAREKGCLKSFDNYGDDGFYFTIYKEKGYNNKPSWNTHFHIKYVYQLIDIVDEHDSINQDFGWEFNLQ